MGDFIKTKPLNKKLKLLNFSSVCTVWARCAGSLLEPPPNQPSAQEEPEDGLRQPKQPRLPEPDRLGHGERTLSVWWITAETPVGSHRSFHLPTLKTCCDMIQNRTHAHLLHNSCHENMTGATIKDTSSVPACPGNWLFFSLFFFLFFIFIFFKDQLWRRPRSPEGKLDKWLQKRSPSVHMDRERGRFEKVGWVQLQPRQIRTVLGVCSGHVYRWFEMIPVVWASSWPLYGFCRDTFNVSYFSHCNCVLQSWEFLGFLAASSPTSTRLMTPTATWWLRSITPRPARNWPTVTTASGG